MEQSEQVIELLTALCAARVEFPPIVRNREGFSKRGGQKYQYADLNAIIDATAPVLASHGLTMMQFIEDAPDELHAVVRSILSHLSGQWIASKLTVKREEDPQNFGIITTYAKRYVQQAMLNISTEDDPDGLTVKTAEKFTEKPKPREGSTRQPDTRDPEPQIHAPVVATNPQPPAVNGGYVGVALTGKPTTAEVEALWALMRVAYGDEVVVERELRGALKIPAHLDLTIPRMRGAMTRDIYTRLDGAARSLSPRQDDQLVDSAMNAHEPQGETTSPGDGEVSIEEGSLPQEVESAHVGVVEEKSLPEVDATGFRPLATDAQGHVLSEEMNRLSQFAEEHGQEDLLKAMFLETPQMTPGRYMYCWVQIAQKAGVKV